MPKRLGARKPPDSIRSKSTVWRASHEFPLEDPAAAAALAASVGAAGAQVTLKAVMHSDLKIVDPIWTTAYITRNHGYMIYDTLFAMDEKGEIKPQMVDKYDESSADKLT